MVFYVINISILLFLRGSIDVHAQS